MSTYSHITYHIVLNVFLCITFCAAGVTDASLCAGSDSSTSTTVLSNDECSNTGSEATPQSEEVSINVSCECMKMKEKLPREQQTGQLVKEVRSCLTSFFFLPYQTNNASKAGNNKQLSLVRNTVRIRSAHVYLSLFT